MILKPTHYSFPYEPGLTVDLCSVTPVSVGLIQYGRLNPVEQSGLGCCWFWGLWFQAPLVLLATFAPRLPKICMKGSKKANQSANDQHKNESLFLFKSWNHMLFLLSRSNYHLWFWDTFSLWSHGTTFKSHNFFFYEWPKDSKKTLEDQKLIFLEPPWFYSSKYVSLYWFLINTNGRAVVGLYRLAGPRGGQGRWLMRDQNQNWTRHMQGNWSQPIVKHLVNVKRVINKSWCGISKVYLNSKDTFTQISHTYANIVLYYDHAEATLSFWLAWPSPREDKDDDCE